VVVPPFGMIVVKRKQSYVWMLWTYFTTFLAFFHTRCKWTFFLWTFF